MNKVLIVIALSLTIYIPIIVQADEGRFLSTDFWKTATLEDVNKALKNGADVNARSKDDMTPLMTAAGFNQNPDVIEVLIKNGADIKSRNIDSWTALMVAALTNQNSYVINLLIKNGADINAKRKDGWTVLMSAALTNQNSYVINLLIKKA